MRDKLIIIIEKHGLWFFALWCVFLVLALTSCSEINQASEQRLEKRNNAEEINAKIYKTMYDSEIIETFEMDGYKVILWHNGYGSDMEVIPKKLIRKELQTSESDPTINQNKDELD